MRSRRGWGDFGDAYGTATVFGGLPSLWANGPNTGAKRRGIAHQAIR